MPAKKPSTDLTAHRLKQVETHIEKIMDSVSDIRDSLNALVRIETEQQNNAKAIERAFARIDGIEQTLNGKQNQPGLVASIGAVKEIVHSHRWALRTIAGAFVTQIAVLVFALYGT